MGDLFEYEITKYDPMLWTDGYDISSEWTEFSDIGKVFKGERLTLEEYVSVENLYVVAVLMLLEAYNSKEIKIVALSSMNNKHKSLLEFSKKNENLKKAIFLNSRVSDIATISDIVRLGLRGCFGNFQIELDSKTKSRLSFSYDMYIFYITTKPKYVILERIHDMGLFVR